MDVQEYINILENVLLPSVRNIYTIAEVPTIRLVQDNCFVHTAYIVKEWFAHHPEIIVLNWPAKTPDLNLIENVWAQRGFLVMREQEKLWLHTRRMHGKHFKARMTSSPIFAIRYLNGCIK